MQSELNAKVQGMVGGFAVQVAAELARWASVRTPEAFRQAELEIHGLARDLGDEITEAVLRTLVSDRDFQVEASVAGRQNGRFRHGGLRTALVTLLGGRQVKLEGIEYLKPNFRGGRRRGRKRTKRGKGGAGFYPVLACLGIWFGVTPALAGEVCRQVVDSDSVRTAREALARRGIVFGQRKIQLLANKFGARAVEQRNAWLAKVRAEAAMRGPLRGKRIVVSLDGGRLRERVPAKRGRKRKNGHRRYDAPWREPKVLTIYVVNGKGELEEDYRAVYDGTLGDCEAIFDMLCGYLKALGAHEAKEAIFVADGAKWIWDRVPTLAAQVGIDAAKITQVIDWCHAVQTLWAIAEAPKAWQQSDREKWVGRAKDLLHAGRTDDVAAMIDELAVGRRAPAVKEHRDYFVRNAARMQYAAFEAAHVPTGSGYVESAIRRVVNMRLKGNGTFWLERNAESMLFLRCYLKTGHYDTLVQWSITCAVPWWSHRIPQNENISSPINIVRDRIAA